MRLERLVHVVPDEASTDLRRVCRRVVRNGIEARHCDLHAFRGREARVSRMPAALDLVTLRQRCIR